MDDRSQALQQLRAAEAQLSSPEGNSVEPKRPPLIVITAFFEVDKTISFTFPSNTDVWSRLSSVSRKHQRVEKSYARVLSAAGYGVTTAVGPSWERGGTQSATAPVPWIVLQSTHTTTPLVLHAEELRFAMVEVAKTVPHCVLDGDRAIKGSQFWREWKYLQTLSDRSAHDIASLVDVKYNARGSKGATQQTFPGELLRPLATTALVAPVNTMSDGALDL